MAGEENLDTGDVRAPQSEDKVDHWVAEIEKWVTKMDRGMGEGGAADGADPAGEELGPPRGPAPRPAV